MAGYDWEKGKVGSGDWSVDGKNTSAKSVSEWESGS